MRDGGRGVDVIRYKVDIISLENIPVTVPSPSHFIPRNPLNFLLRLY